MKNKIKWNDREGDRGQYTDEVNGVYLSYQPNNGIHRDPDIDASNPETAIVYKDEAKNSGKRFLIYRGDWREELEKLFPDLEALKQHYREHGGHFWSDGLDE